jgi:hypothetical protein
MSSHGYRTCPKVSCIFPVKFVATMNTEAAVITIGAVHDVVLGYMRDGTAYEGNRRFQSFLKQRHLTTRRVTRSRLALLDEDQDGLLQNGKNAWIDWTNGRVLILRVAF